MGHKVAVLLSAYNGEKYIKCQIESIMTQNDVEVHCYVRDDGSDDNTVSILSELCSTYGEKLSYKADANVGFAKSFYDLVKERGDFDFYAFSDQDDVWLPDKLKSCIELIKSDEVPRLSFCNCRLVDIELRDLGVMHTDSLDVSDKIKNLFINPAPGCTMVFNKAAKDFFLEAANDEIEYHDHWMLTVCSYFGEVVYTPEAYIMYRQHGNNVVGCERGFKAKLKHRLKVLKQDTHDSEKMAKALLRYFDKRLSAEDMAVLSKVANYRHKIFGKLRLASSKDITAHLSDRKKWFKRRVFLGKL